MSTRVKRTAIDKAAYAAYLHGPVWRRKRDAAMARASGICEFMIEDFTYDASDPFLKRCDAQAVHCHHLTYEHIFNEPLEDLQALCEFHHKVAHVWDRELKCERCHDGVFDSIDDAAWHVESFPDCDLESLYAEAPSLCSYCDYMMNKDD